ncbi:MAG: hypothetical protein P1U56_18840 [Saprospiraceae bacterium]|nr:hypothetical protein [Saprospiraceae bacterium]
MDKYLNSVLFSFMFFITANTLAQPNYIYEGGNGGGYTLDNSISVNIYFYKGGNGDGFSAIKESAVNAYFYKGGNADGFSSIKSSIVNAYLYEGGNADGFSSIKNTGVNTYLYAGGTHAGYTKAEENYDQVTFYEGDIGQGYDLAEKYEDFIWTGAVGTGWAVDNNWNYSIVPDINRRAIIPDGVPNFPNVNAGIFAIGDNPNNGQFECKSLWIQENAEVITRVNNFIENYGLIRIDGMMTVKNPASNALQNSSSGLIRIRPTGSLTIKP